MAPTKMTDDNSNEGQPERSILTSTQLSMERFELFMSKACELSLDDWLIQEGNRCITIAQLECFRWPIITKAERVEAHRLRVLAINAEKVWMDKSWTLDKYGQMKKVNPEEEWNAARNASTTWRNYVMKLGMQIWGERKSIEGKLYKEFW